MPNTEYNRIGQGIIYALEKVGASKAFLSLLLSLGTLFHGFAVAASYTTDSTSDQTSLFNEQAEVWLAHPNQQHAHWLSFLNTTAETYVSNPKSNTYDGHSSRKSTPVAYYEALRPSSSMETVLSSNYIGARIKLIASKHLSFQTIHHQRHFSLLASSRSKAAEDHIITA